MLRKLHALLLLLTVVFSQNALSDTDFDTKPVKDIFSSGPNFLEVDQAFMFSYEQKGKQLSLSWVIADDYYLYADKFQFAIENANIVNQSQPEGTQIIDDFFGATKVYFFEVNKLPFGNYIQLLTFGIKE